MIKAPKKLIEVALPLDDINKACAYEKLPGIGAHPRAIHLWWARRPLAAARAVLFSQLVNDPGGERGWGKYPGQTKEDAQKERERLFSILRDLVKWENTNNYDLISKAREEIIKSWKETCELNKGESGFDPNKLPSFHDPFSGGGAIPLESLRLGLNTFATDLNPVAVMINKAMIEIPSKFAGKTPVGPIPKGEQRQNRGEADWQGVRGLAEDVRRYGHWMQNEALKRIGHLYPKVEITNDLIEIQPELKQYKDKKLDVIALLWARTVKSPNPAYSSCHVPLVSSFMLATKKGNQTYIKPIIHNENYTFHVVKGEPFDIETVKSGTSAGKWKGFKCILSDSTISFDHIRNEGAAGRLGIRLLAVVAKGKKGKIYISPTKEMETIAFKTEPSWLPDLQINHHPRDIKTQIYGLFTYSDLFTKRQLVALETLSILVSEVRDKVVQDAKQCGWLDDKKSLEEDGVLASAYGDAISTYLSFVISRLADFGSSLSTWKPSGEQVMHVFTRQALPMTWDFPESNFLGTSSICLLKAIKYISEGILAIGSVDFNVKGFALQADAQTQAISTGKIVSTDPPYYDNISYADLSDFFYVWLRKTLKPIFPNLFSTIAVPKSEELVASPYRHGNQSNAEMFFMNGMKKSLKQIVEKSNKSYPITIYYAFKQSNSSNKDGTSSAGWESFLEAVIGIGLTINGTWPLRSEQEYRMMGMGKNALASSIVLVCRERAHNAQSIPRRQFIRELKEELPDALEAMIGGKKGASPIAPVDLAQAAIGPGMAVFSSYSSIIDADGSIMSVRDALIQINKVLDEFFYEAEGDMDSDTRFCIDWFMQFGFKQAEFGQANILAQAKGTTVDGLVTAGVVKSGGGRVRLLKYTDYSESWDPESDAQIPTWEALHQLIRALRSGGEEEAGILLKKMTEKTESIRQLAYRLYTLCERKGWAEEARAYNELIASWHGTVEAAEKVLATTRKEKHLTLDM